MNPSPASPPPAHPSGRPAPPPVLPVASPLVSPAASALPPSAAAPLAAYAGAVAACVATALMATPLIGVVDLANIVMLFLLVVVLVALSLGRGPAVLAAFLSVALFDFLFVPPRFSLAVVDAQYLITFAVMLAVALLIGQLTARLRLEAEETARRETQTRALYDMARELSGAVDAAQVQAVAGRFVRNALDASLTLLLPDAAGHLHPVDAGSDGSDGSGGSDGSDGGKAAGPATRKGVHIPAVHADAVFASGQAMMFVADQDGFAPAMLFPLSAPQRVCGVMVVSAASAERVLPAARRPLLEAVASLAAIVVERLDSVAAVQHAQFGIESERLRSSLLSAVSHDLRTPLTVLVGLADSLAVGKPPLPPAQAETAAAIREQALRMSGLVHNLLDMARLQAGKVCLRREWQPFEEVVGSALSGLEAGLHGRCVRIELPADLPLLEFDAVLIERVLHNLLENAAKYAPDGEISIGARVLPEVVEIAVCDAGPGLPPGGEERLFSLFERGRHEGGTDGAGLGLAICRAIVEAHGGAIRAEPHAGGGACFRFTLPRGTPPAFDAPPGEA